MQNRPAGQAQHAYTLADGSIIFLGRFTVDADGVPRAYHPDGVSGQDALSNGGHPGDWWALATDSAGCGHAGNPIVQGAEDPNPGFYASTTTMSDPAVRDCKKQRRYVNSDAISYVALSPAIARLRNDSGNQVIVAAKGVSAGMAAVFADGAPRHGMGEGSMQLARRLGLSSDPRNGGTDSRELIYLVLPKTISFPVSETTLVSGVDADFRTWGGGDERLAACRTALANKPL